MKHVNTNLWNYIQRCCCRKWLSTCFRPIRLENPTVPSKFFWAWKTWAMTLLKLSCPADRQYTWHLDICLNHMSPDELPGQLPCITSPKPGSNLNNTPSLRSDIWPEWHGSVDMRCAAFNMLISEICQGFLGAVKAKLGPNKKKKKKKKKPLGFSRPSTLASFWGFDLPTHHSASPKTDWAFYFQAKKYVLRLRMHTPGQDTWFFFLSFSFRQSWQ